MSLLGIDISLAGSLPMLLIGIDRDARVTEVVGSPSILSAFGGTIVGQKITDSLFRENWDALSATQKEILADLGKTVGDPAMLGELLAAQLPTQITRTAPETQGAQKKHDFHLRYCFVEKAGAIDQVVICLFLADANPASSTSTSTGGQPSSIEVRNDHESLLTTLVLQIQRADSRLFDIVIAEIDTHIKNLRHLLDEPGGAPLDELRRTFHAMKGSTRQLGLSEFSKKCLACEQWMKDSIRDQKLEGGVVQLRARSAELERDWAQIRALRAALLSI